VRRQTAGKKSKGKRKKESFVFFAKASIDVTTSLLDKNNGSALERARFEAPM
jgi:hypothetical protein